jgi:hypothetical protein
VYNVLQSQEIISIVHPFYSFSSVSVLEQEHLKNTMPSPTAHQTQPLLANIFPLSLSSCSAAGSGFAYLLVCRRVGMDKRRRLQKTWPSFGILFPLASVHQLCLKVKTFFLGFYVFLSSL